jgi:hypothetical protein
MSSRLCAVSSTPSSHNDGVDLILPCQYHDLSGGHHLTGEQRLMLALLADAINVYQKGALSRLNRPRRLYVDAEQWIMADCGQQPTMLSFNMACEALSINSGLLRRRIIEWKHEVHRKRDGCQAIETHFEVVRRERHSSHRRGRPAAPVFQAS